MASEKVLRDGNKPGMSVFKGSEKINCNIVSWENGEETGTIGRTSMWALVSSLYFIQRQWDQHRLSRPFGALCRIPLVYI